ncbi:LysR family transcriptional regulator [Paraburkholderia sp. LEh10]|uniref:LysR family transcriptional regulator n=1 Tax=Paraburkholderia sp. LEh10 TaxID=2821353 RepID=UPI001AEA416E|nr:LysR family transcriptional regulator [Paraburkholderia sp. LEh10]MBP0590440.1 LysR family transcriptional regulator [Paraburkholderia sp. LEh10]
MRREDLSDLLAFARIADERSFTRAAHKLGLSGSALSHAMRLLEERLNVKLLHRTTRSVAATPAGERLLERLHPALAEIEDAIDVLAEDSARATGLVRINTHRSAASLIVLPKLEELAKLHPSLTVELTSNDNDIDIVAGGFDAGIRYGEHVARDMTAVRISQKTRTVVVASPQYLAATPKIAAPSDLAAHRCLVWRAPTSGAMLRWEFRKDSRKVNAIVDPSFISNDMGLLIDAAIRNLGVLYTLHDQVQMAIASGDLVELLPSWSLPRDACYLYYPSRRQLRPVLRIVIDALRTYHE